MHNYKIVKNQILSTTALGYSEVHLPRGKKKSKNVALKYKDHKAPNSF